MRRRRTAKRCPTNYTLVNGVCKETNTKPKIRRPGRNESRDACPSPCIDPGTFSCVYEGNSPVGQWVIHNLCTGNASVPALFQSPWHHHNCNHTITNYNCLRPTECASIPACSASTHAYSWHECQTMFNPPRCPNSQGGCDTCPTSGVGYTYTIAGGQTAEGSDNKGWGRKGGRINRSRRKR